MIDNFTKEDASRLCGLADQFMEDWEANEGKGDPECIERRKEWDAIRPLFVAAPALLEALKAQEMADADPEASRRKGYYDRARVLRSAALAKAEGRTV